MPDRKRLEALFAEITQTVEREKRDYAGDALLAALWVETGEKREAIVRALCGVSQSGGGVVAVRICRKFGAGEASIPLPPPPARERRRLIGAIAVEVGQSTLHTLAAYAKDPAEAESAEALIEVQCLYDLFRLMELLRLPETLASAFQFLLSGYLRPLTWYPVVQHAACRAIAALPLSEQGVVYGALGISQRMSQALLPVLDYVNNLEAVPDIARLIGGILSSHEDPIIWEEVAWKVIKALERMGDRRALPMLRRVASGQRGGMNLLQNFVLREIHGERPISESLRQEARRVILAIERGGSVDRQTLLRPSSIDNAELLRPSMERDGEQKERGELLRPGAKDEDEG
ncbi:MAG: hypothetical protein H7308_08980 [Chthonomonadaceae bacterium]|nr:hypothetical protein [Chthonomonadaceae bacterium]